MESTTVLFLNLSQCKNLINILISIDKGATSADFLNAKQCIETFGAVRLNHIGNTSFERPINIFREQL